MTTAMNQDAGRDASGATGQAPVDTQKNLQAASGNDEQSAQDKADDPVEGSDSPEVTGEDDEETSETGEDSEEEDDEEDDDEAEGEEAGGGAGASASARVAQHTSGGSPGGLSGD